MATQSTQLVFTKIKSAATPLELHGMVGDLLQWLTEQPQVGGPRRDAGLQWLLATTFSEVVWGLKKDGVWQLSPQGTTLPAGRLLELRAFGAVTEIFVWRDPAGLRARLRRDEAPKSEDGGEGGDTYDEEQLLWGTVRLDGAPDGFTRLAEGDQGLVHEPPLELDASYFVKERDEQGKVNKHYGHRPARLVLRHYVEREAETGLARVVDSRLVEVRAVLPGEKKEANEDESPA